MVREVLSYALLLALVAVAGCGDKTKSDSPTAVVAKVNGRPITRAQADAFLAFKHVAAQGPRRDEALASYLEREALADVIASEKLLDQAAIDAELNEFRKEMLLSRYFEKFLSDKVDEAAIRGYYTSHQADYERHEVHVAHILFRTHDRMAAEEKQARLTAASEAHSKLLAGADFAELADAISEDRVSGKRGGDLGWMKQGSVGPAFSEKAFAMKPGEVSAPLETSFGYHVIKLLEGPRTVKQPYEVVKGDIRYQLRAEAKKVESERLLAKIKIESDSVKVPAPASAPAAQKTTEPVARQDSSPAKEQKP